jgi:hypothetical protein
MDISAPEPLYRFLLITQSRRLCRLAADVDAGDATHGTGDSYPTFLASANVFCPRRTPSNGHAHRSSEPRTEQPARIGTLPPSLPSGARWTTPCLPGLQSLLS